jgi:hypothetical protein
MPSPASPGPNPVDPAEPWEMTRQDVDETPVSELSRLITGLRHVGPIAEEMTPGWYTYAPDSRRFMFKMAFQWADDVLDFDGFEKVWNPPKR